MVLFIKTRSLFYLGVLRQPSIVFELPIEIQRNNVFHVSLLAEEEEAAPQEFDFIPQNIWCLSCMWIFVKIIWIYTWNICNAAVKFCVEKCVLCVIILFFIYKHIYRSANHVSICCFSGDIIFNAHYPDLPPDFIFGEDAEFLPDPSALHVSTLLFENLTPCRETLLF